MTTRRWWVIGCALMMVVSIGFGWLLGVSPMLDAAQTADTTRESVDAQNLVYEQELATLKDQFAGIGELETQLADLHSQVPAGSALPAYIAQLVASSQQHAVVLTSLTVSDAVAYTPVVAPIATTTDAAATDAAPADAATPAPQAVPAPDAQGAGTPVTSPLVTGQNFIAIPIAVAFDGGYGNVLDFVESLQKGTRLTTVTAFGTTKADAPASVAAVDEDAPASAPVATDKVKGTLSLYIYVLLDPSATGAG